MTFRSRWRAESTRERVTLRFPPSLHERAVLRATLEGMSLNRFLSAAVATSVDELSGRE